jgi:hypothetical protein
MVTDEPLDRTVLEALRRLQSEARPNFPSMIVGLFLDTAPSVLKELEPLPWAERYPRCAQPTTGCFREARQSALCSSRLFATTSNSTGGRE